jgi:hypothetical protein
MEEGALIYRLSDLNSQGQVYFTHGHCRCLTETAAAAAAEEEEEEEELRDSIRTDVLHTDAIHSRPWFWAKTPERAMTGRATENKLSFICQMRGVLHEVGSDSRVRTLYVPTSIAPYCGNKNLYEDDPCSGRWTVTRGHERVVLGGMPSGTTWPVLRTVMG